MDLQRLWIYSQMISMPTNTALHTAVLPPPPPLSSPSSQLVLYGCLANNRGTGKLETLSELLQDVRQTTRDRVVIVSNYTQISFF